MFKFFESISNIIDTVVDMFLYTVNAVTDFFSFITQGITFFTEALSFMPPFCQGIIFAVCGVSILSVILSAFIDLG